MCLRNENVFFFHGHTISACRKSVILAGEKRGEDDEEFEVQLYSRSHYPGWRNNVQNATIEIEFEPDMYKMIEHPLGTGT